jgi:hypothetical protein
VSFRRTAASAAYPAVVRWTPSRWAPAHEAADGYFPDTDLEFATLSNRWRMQTFDPQWGRDDLLWDRLVPAMETAADAEDSPQIGGQAVDSALLT